MDKDYFIYGIYDEQEPDRIRYVGLTTTSLKERLRNHWTYSRPKYRKTRIQCWMYSRRGRRQDVGIKVLDTANSYEELKKKEIEQISKHRGLGMADLNLTAGGEGLLGYKKSEESKKALSEKYRETGGPSAKLTWKEVNEIRAHRIKTYEPAEEVAKRYGVRRTAVDRILNNTMWRDEAYDPHSIKPRPGGMHAGAKLSLNQVNEIRNLRKEVWVSAASLAEKYGVSEPAMQGLLKNRTYYDPEYDHSQIKPYEKGRWTK